MAEFNGKSGVWRTSETGIHYFIPDGVEPEQAWAEWSKNRHYLQYWEASEPDKYGLRSYAGISKKRYNELLKNNKATRITDFFEDRWHRYDIPEDIEQKMIDSLENIKSIENKRDFFEQLRQEMANRDIYRAGSLQVVWDAFDNEIKEKYDKLIKPVMKKIDSIDIDNSYQTFESGLNKSQNISTEFKTKVLENFDKCVDEDCKIMLAIATDIYGIEYSNNEYEDGKKAWSYCSFDCSRINILNRHNDAETLFHEGFHSIFGRYNVKESGLKETIKKEMNHAKKVDSIYEYFEDKYCKENNLESKQYYINKQEELRTKRDNLYNKVLEESSQKYNGLKTMKAYDDAHKILREQHPEYQEWDTEFWKMYHQIKKIENSVENELAIKYINLNDMISAATWNKRGAGHTGQYWANNKNNQANEFFAEMAAMKATGNTEEYELIKKFAPESVKKFEEIFSNIIKNKKGPLEL